MISVGGNTTALIQVKDEGKKNIIGEKEHVWMDVTSLKGWLDLSNGQNDISEYSAKVQSSTHISSVILNPSGIFQRNGFGIHSI